MLRTNVVPLSETLALEAADTSLEHALAMADAIVYATARSRLADLVTTDSDLEGLPGSFPLEEETLNVRISRVNR